MELVETVVSLALVVKQLSDDANTNVALCQSLGNRAEMIPRILERLPNYSALDEGLMSRILQTLKQSHDLITEYQQKGAISRFLKSSLLKSKFSDIESQLGKCVDDLTLCVGVTSAVALDALSSDFKRLFYDNMTTDEVSLHEIPIVEHIIDYSLIHFETKRGVRKELGGSQHARVYCGELNGNKVAVKESLLSSVEGVDSIADQWRDGVNILSELIHPSVCRTLGGGCEILDDDLEPPQTLPHFYLIMEQLSDINLADFVTTSFKNEIDVSTVFKFSHAIAAGVLYIHSCRPAITHGHLCPQNILLTDDNKPRIVNILLRHEQLIGNMDPSRRVSMVECHPFMAPEQARGAPPTPASDIYSLGMIMYFMLTGTEPFAECQSSHSLAEAVRSGKAPVIPSIDPFLLDLISMCVSSDPSRRPSARACVRALAAVCRERKVDMLVCDVERTDIKQDDERSDDDGLAEFGDMSDKVETMLSTVKLFGSESILSPSVVVYGNKVILYNFRHNVSTALTAEVNDDEEEEEGGDESGVGCTACSGPLSVPVGTVIFHIDNTASMKRNQRMDLTKEVLLRVIPRFLRCSMRVIVNSWASNDKTKGRIQSRELSVEPSLLEEERADELRKYIHATAFDVLCPEGRTDMYGSCFQLFRQCRDYATTGSVHAFVLTDGNHNRLDYPLHRPAEPNEDYFGVYRAVLNKGTRFGPSSKPFSVDYAENFLRQEYDILLALAADHTVSLTLIGIGDASTQSLSSLCARMGDSCCFYGITEVGQADDAFRAVASSQDEIRFEIPEGPSFTLSRSNDDGTAIYGTSVLDDPIDLEKLHNCQYVRLKYKERVMELGAFSTAISRSIQLPIEEFVSAIRKIREGCYDITSESFSSVFCQLMKDKKELWALKSSFFSKKTRKLRQMSAFAAFGIWLREIEEILDAQISSYRMNVEEEILNNMNSSNDEKFNEGESPSSSFKPSSVVLERLQNNMRNAGRSAHKVSRHVVAIQRMRDRTMHICAKLLTSKLTLQESEEGIRLHVQKQGSDYVTNWTVLDANDMDATTVSDMRSLFETASVIEDISILHAHLQAAISSESSVRGTIDLTYPCVVVRSNFDPFTIIRAPYLFTVQNVQIPKTSNQTIASSDVYCAEEIWDLCHSSDHTPGSDLPGFAHLDSSCRPNMIIPLAHIPLLFTLYVERSRLFHSGVNITGDCMALGQGSLQWGKLFFDALMHPNSPTKMHWMENGLMSLVSYSYAITSYVLHPSMNSVNDMFSSPNCVLSREITPSITCPLAVAAIVACDAECTKTSESWNMIIRTVFSRMVECISGNKPIRIPTSADPGELDEAYRIHLGKLQTVLGRRLNIEWAKSSNAEKVDIVKENAAEVLDLLSAIVAGFLSMFEKYGLPLWSEWIRAIREAMELKNIGILKLRAHFVSCKKTSSILNVIMKACAVNDEIALPVVELSSCGRLSIRQVSCDDYSHLAAYIDAIVATKASPKLEYKPVLNPTYPLFTAAQNREVNSLESYKCSLDSSKPVVNIAFVGNVNSGKSSICGRILLEFQVVSGRCVENLGNLAEEIGYSSNLKHSWVMDKEAYERAGGFTMRPKHVGFQTPSRRFSIIDNPGHKDFVTNATAGIYHADVIVLVVPAVMSEIELAEMSRSQAEEHLLCAFCFGVKHVLVVVNKMDAVSYNQESFNRVRTHTTKHLKKAGFKADQSLFIPVSALYGDGVLDDSPNMTWYDGPCLIQALDECHIPRRQVDKPFRMVVDEVFKLRGTGTVLCGKVERGTISVGDSVNIYPAIESSDSSGVVRSVEAYGNSLQCAGPGDEIGINISFKKVQTNKLKHGMVLGLSNNPAVPVMRKFEAQVFVTRKINFKAGYSPTILVHCISVKAQVHHISQIIDRNNTVLETNPKTVNVSQICVCEMVALRPFAAETVHDFPRMSKFLIRENRVIVAVGFIRSRLE